MKKAPRREDVQDLLEKYEDMIEDICKAIEETGSLLSASEKLNLPYSDLKILERFDKRVSNACFYSNCKNIDKVERELIKVALNGNLDAIKFYLETVGRNRFYKIDEKIINVKRNVGDAINDFIKYK